MKLWDLAKMSFNAYRKESLQAALIISFFTIVNHGLILLNDGVYWDDWINYIALLDKDWQKIFFVYTKAGGIPLSAYVHWVFSYAPNVIVAYRLVTLLCIGLTSLFIYWIARYKLNLNNSMAVLAAVLALSYPAFQMSATIVGTVLWIYYFFFLIGAWLVFVSFQVKGKKVLFIRLAALILLFASYRFEVLLLLSYAIVLIDMFSEIKGKTSGLRFLDVKYFLQRLDLLALPVLYWIYSHTYFPDPTNLDYNQFVFGSIGTAIFGFLNNTFLQQAARLWEILWFIWPFALAMIAVAWLVGQRVKVFDSSGNPKLKIYLLVFCLLLFLMAVIPPVLVGKAGSSIGYGTRHALALGWSVGLLLAALSSALVGRFPKIKVLVTAFLFFLIFAFAATNAYTYLVWQARWAKDQSLMQHLRTSVEAKKYSVYLVEDNFPVPGLENYRFYEWAGMFRLIWGDETRVGVQEGYYSVNALMNVPPLFLQHYNTEDVDLNGCYARLEITENLDMPFAEIGLRYIAYRIAFPDRLSTFLEALTSVEVNPIDREFETNCPGN
jgi:hypothetical protein